MSLKYPSMHNTLRYCAEMGQRAVPRPPPQLFDGRYPIHPHTRTLPEASSPTIIGAMLIFIVDDVNITPACC